MALFAVFQLMAIQASPSRADEIITGSFHWTGVGYNGVSDFGSESGTAYFVYDADTNSGTLTDFYPGYSTFSVTDVSVVPNPNDLPSDISSPVTTFAELTDFKTETVQEPGPANTTITVTDGHDWSFLDLPGGSYGDVALNHWSGTSDYGLDVFDGTVSNFQEALAVPEPSSLAGLAMGILFLLLVGLGHFKISRAQRLGCSE